MLPIVLGQVDYERFAPPHSSNNVTDFGSAKELVGFLHQLDKKNEEYLSYFWWRDFYRVVSDEHRMRMASFCDLCALLNDEDRESQYQEDLDQWWNKKANTKRHHEKWLKILAGKAFWQPIINCHMLNKLC